MNVEARSPHNELSHAHQCLQTHREARIKESHPSALPPAIPKGQEGPACSKLAQVNSGLPPLLQPQPNAKYRKDCVSTVALKNGFLVAGTAYFTFLPHLQKAKLPVSAGVTKGLPHAGQGTSHHFNSIAAGALATPISPTALSAFGKHRGAGRSFPHLAGQGREMNTRCFFTIVLREKPARFQVKLLLTDLLLEPELQVSPVPRGEQGIIESIRLEKTSEIIKSNLPTPPDHGTECCTQSFLEHL